MRVAFEDAETSGENVGSAEAESLPVTEGVDEGDLLGCGELLALGDGEEEEDWGKEALAWELAVPPRAGEPVNTGEVDEEALWLEDTLREDVAELLPRTPPALAVAPPAAMREAEGVGE